MMILPIELNDESLYSLVTRVAILNGLSPKYLNNEISSKDTNRAADIAIDFKKLAKFTRGLYGDENEIMSRFKSWSTFKNKDSFLVGISNSSRNIWRWCPECLKYEITEFGVAYWHIHHQEIFVRACPQHHAPLLEINIPFRERQSRLLLPTEAIRLKHKPSCNIDFVPMSLSISKIIKCLQINKTGFNIETLELVFKDQLKVEHLERKFKNICNSLSTGAQNISMGYSKILVNPPFLFDYLPLLIYVHFENIEMFLNQYQWSEVLNITIIHKSQAKLTHREILNECLTDNPELSRTDLWKLHPKTARWLTKHDITWLEQKLPTSIGNKLAYQLSLTY